jgi:5,10-methylenetetrahydromethanopterin reductase
MAWIKIGIRIPPCRPVPQVADAVRRAELAGFDSVAMPESPMLWRDTVAALVASAAVTERVVVRAAARADRARRGRVAAEAGPYGVKEKPS